MKSIISIVFLLLFTVETYGTNVIQTTSFDRLPENARSFIHQYFPDDLISYIDVDKEFFSVKYEVVFTKGFEIEFDSNGRWLGVDCKKNAIPPGIIPEAIVNYVAVNFVDSYIVQVERRAFGYYEVELRSGLDIIFDKKGNFVRIED